MPAETTRQRFEAAWRRERIESGLETMQPSAWYAVQHLAHLRPHDDPAGGTYSAEHYLEEALYWGRHALLAHRNRGSERALCLSNALRALGKVANRRWRKLPGGGL